MGAPASFESEQFTAKQTALTTASASSTYSTYSTSPKEPTPSPTHFLLPFGIPTHSHYNRQHLNQVSPMDIMDQMPMPQMDGMNAQMNQLDPTATLETVGQPLPLHHSWEQSFEQSLEQSLSQTHYQMLAPSNYLTAEDYQAQWLQSQGTDWRAAFDNQALGPSDNQSQMLDPSNYMTTEDYQTQWLQSGGTVWDVPSHDQALGDTDAGFPPQAAFNGATRDDGASAACSSHCDVNCMSQCDDLANADCCFDPLCEGLDLNHAACCFDEFCNIPEPCLDESCHNTAHPCNDADCMLPAVSMTPAAVPVLTPTEPVVDAMANAVVDPVEQLRELAVAMDTSMFRSGPAPQANEPLLMGAGDEFRCRWAGPDGGLCAAVFNDSKDLQGHCKEVHLKAMKKLDGGFRCSWNPCARQKAFSQKSKLERHMQTHTGFKPVWCKICGAPLSAKQSLEQHMRVHSGDKPWQCDFGACKQAFKQQSALTMHKRTHTGEKPLQCEVCGKRFGESSNLSKHRRTHNVKGAFICDCGKDFHRMDQVRRHGKGCAERKKAKAKAKAAAAAAKAAGQNFNAVAA